MCAVSGRLPGSAAHYWLSALFSCRSARGVRAFRPRGPTAARKAHALPLLSNLRAERYKGHEGLTVSSPGNGH
eukprot:12330270-Heterocapsa_arctica.AAC.1